MFAVAASENLLQGDFLFRVYLAPLLDFVLECSAVQAYSFTGQLQKLISQGQPGRSGESCPQDNEPERRLVFGVGYGSHFKPACHSGHVQSVDWIQFVYDEVEARSK